MADQTRINGNQHSWGSISIKFGGERFTGVIAIKYADSRERVKAYGMGRHQAPRGRSRGKYTTEPVGLTLWKGSAQELRAKLAAVAPDGRSYGDVEFEIVVQYVEVDDTSVIVQIERCVLTKNATDDEESADPLKDELEADCMLIRRNGLTLFDSSVDQP
jgi:hypothetical protein